MRQSRQGKPLQEVALEQRPQRNSKDKVGEGKIYREGTASTKALG